jgi:hypothetical protein
LLGTREKDRKRDIFIEEKKTFFVLNYNATQLIRHCNSYVAKTHGKRMAEEEGRGKDE